MSDDIRAEVRDWLADNWDRDLPHDEWRRRVVESGWAAPTWPVEYFGRGLDADARKIVDEEFAAVGATGTGIDVMNLYANTILAHGTKEQKDAFVRPLALRRASRVPALQRTGRRVGPRRAADPRRSRR